MEEIICEYIGLIKEYNIEMDLSSMRFEDFVLMLVKIHVLPALNQWRILVDTIPNLWIPQRSVNMWRN
jgi:hypothetical protein